MIDNLDEILPLLEFSSKDDFYYLQILQRKKEHPELGSNSRVIKNYYIRSEKYLLDRYDEIKKLCQVFNARAALRLNKRSYERTAFKALTNLSNSMMNKAYKFSNKSYDRACGQGHNDNNKKWIIDIDEKEVSPLILTFINYHCDPICRSLEESKIYGIIPSKNGFHIITKPFNIEKFKIKFPEIEIHKDNPTNLYIP